MICAAHISKIHKVGLRSQSALRKLVRMMPGLRTADWNGKKAIGLKFLLEQFGEAACEAVARQGSGTEMWHALGA